VDFYLVMENQLQKLLFSAGKKSTGAFYVTRVITAIDKETFHSWTSSPENKSGNITANESRPSCFQSI